MRTRFSRTPAARVSVPVVGAGPSDGPKRSRGAQPGNLNAALHGGQSSDLNEKRSRARELRDQDARAVREEQDRILKAYGLQDDPLARNIALQGARIEMRIRRLEHFHAHRGLFTRLGEPKASFLLELDAVTKALGVAEKLLARLVDLHEARGAGKRGLEGYLSGRSKRASSTLPVHSSSPEGNAAVPPAEPPRSKSADVWKPPAPPAEAPE